MNSSSRRRVTSIAANIATWLSELTSERGDCPVVLPAGEITCIGDAKPLIGGSSANGSVILHCSTQMRLHEGVVQIQNS